MVKLAEDVEVGDIIMLWTQAGVPRRVGQIDPYVGPLATAADGWRIATFSGELAAGGYTLIPGQTVEVM